jgi:hypothetical protein
LNRLNEGFARFRAVLRHPSQVPRRRRLGGSQAPILTARLRGKDGKTYVVKGGVPVLEGR